VPVAQALQELLPVAAEFDRKQGQGKSAA
jgi:hypothetical protein